MLNHVAQGDSVERFVRRSGVLQSGQRDAQLLLDQGCRGRVRLNSLHSPASITHQSKKVPVTTADVEKFPPVAAIETHSTHHSSFPKMRHPTQDSAKLVPTPAIGQLIATRNESIQSVLTFFAQICPETCRAVAVHTSEVRIVGVICAVQIGDDRPRIKPDKPASGALQESPLPSGAKKMVGQAAVEYSARLSAKDTVHSVFGPNSIAHITSRHKDALRTRHPRSSI